MAKDFHEKAAPYFEMARQAATKEGIRPELLLGLLAQESGFNPNAQSKAGALGIAQFMPATAQAYGINPFDPAQAIPATAKYIRKGVDRYGSEDLALAAYNSGFGNVDKYKGTPPFRETQNYAPAVQALAKQFGGPDMNMLQQSPQFQQAQEPAQPSNLSIDPRSLVGAAPQSMGGGLKTLLTVLGSLGALGGTAANVIGGIKGTGSPGNGALAQSSGIFSMLDEQRKAREAYQQRAQMAQTLPPELAVQALAPKGLADYISERNKPINAKDQLAIQQAQVNLQNTRTPEQKATLELENAKALAEAKGESKKGGKMLTAPQTDTLAEGKSAFDQLNTLKSKYEASAGSRGPVGGLNKYNPYATDTQALQADINATRQIVGKFLEGGVLRKEDESKYEKILPTLSDTPEVAAAKITTVQGLLENKYKNYKDSYGNAGYNVSGYETNNSAPKTNTSIKPNTIEDGYRFLGGDPGKPTSWEKVK